MLKGYIVIYTPTYSIHVQREVINTSRACFFQRIISRLGLASGCQSQPHLAWVPIFVVRAKHAHGRVSRASAVVCFHSLGPQGSAEDSDDDMQQRCERWVPVGMER
mmetsp:Transcript_72504/g.172871  ORF Transcript_72504/g.172871 Transcript_72504/m.172871 type:complete len:106 (+) Transcript_72504:90-407(+)